MKQLLLSCFLLASVPALAQTTATTQTTATAQTTDVKEFVGNYSFADGSPIAKFIVTEKDGVLYGEADSYGSNKLLKQPETDTYQSTSSYGSIVQFERDPATKAIKGLILKVQGQEISAKKEK